MGNQVEISDEGQIMCFNPAKIWYFGWYENHHYSAIPGNQSYDNYLVGFDDMQGRNRDTSKDVIVRVQSKDLFIMYNRAIGSNKEVEEDKNKVVITKETSKSAKSWWQGSLGVGQTYTEGSLVITNCGIDSVDGHERAHVII